MSKVKKLFKGLSLLMKQPSLINKVIDDADVNQMEVIEKYGLKNGLPTIEITDLFPDFNETVSPYAALEGGSTPIDLAFLKACAKKFKECVYLEIGTWRGESVANIAPIAKKCYTINLTDEQMTAIQLTQKHVDLIGFYSKKHANITHIRESSEKFNFKSLNEKVDVAFIDGDHHYEAVKNDTEKVFEILKDSSSIIVWHDYGNTPEDIRWDVLKGILAGTPENKRKYLYRVSNTLCAIYCEQELKGTFHTFPRESEKYFEINVQVKK
ncbi:MAG TPA: class I SAM-dependent methyltransferase [Bacteroidia bacterium]|nr:class I SAM-dependent methyltransferase [Bacteroidia bacterium]